MAIHEHPQYRSAEAGDLRASQTIEPKTPRFWGSKAALVAIGFLLIAAFLLLSEHRAHALGYLPFLLIFGCLFMHMFMHGGHGGHSGHGDGKTPTDRPSPPSEGV